MSFLDSMATPVAVVLNAIHEGLSTFLPSESGWAWGLSVVFLTITVRIALIPLFVKQIKSQRRMQEIAPLMKELQVKHKGDRETLNTELMKLYKEHGTNPISGCLPLLLQMPVFFALFRVMNEFKPKNGEFESKFGLPVETIEEGAKAQVFGAPLSSAFNSSSEFLAQVGGSSTTIKIVAVVMIVTMGLTTFITQKQMMARNGPLQDPQQAQIQKFMLYVLPFSFAIFGFSFPIGVLLYWLTTNFWSVGQQHYVIKRMPVVQPGSSGKPGSKAGKTSTAAPSSGTTKVPSSSMAAVAVAAGGGGGAVADATPKPSQPKNQAHRGKGPNSSKGKSGSRKNKSRKGGRR